MAERVALRVYGAKAVANDLTVHVAITSKRTDTEIAQAAVSVLGMAHRGARRPRDRDRQGRMDLARGTLEWQYQKDAAARAVRDLTGVQGVTNDIRVQPHLKTTDVRAKIEAAFTRSAEIDARRVSVTARDGTVVLAGNVRSWAERREAERAAWAAPGVRQVDDQITVVP